MEMYRCLSTLKAISYKWSFLGCIILTSVTSSKTIESQKLDIDVFRKDQTLFSNHNPKIRISPTLHLLKCCGSNGLTLTLSIGTGFTTGSTNLAKEFFFRTK